MRALTDGTFMLNGAGDQVSALRGRPSRSRLGSSISDTNGASDRNGAKESRGDAD